MDNNPYVNEEHVLGKVTTSIPENFRDLSLDHAPLGCLTKSVASPGGWGKFELTPEQMEQYWRDGYLSNIQVLSEEQCERLLQDYRTFLVPAAQLIDPCKAPRAIRLWHDQLFAKPPHHGGVVAWHQDYSYWTRTTPMLHMTVHVALDDQTLETGGLHFVPGSHRWHRDGLPLPITDPKFGDMESIKSVLTPEELEKFQPRPSGLKRGQASFHHPLMVHGSFANRSDQPRRAAVVNYFADGVQSNTDEVLLNGVPVTPKGQKLTGQFFPVVFDPAWTTTEE